MAESTLTTPRFSSNSARIVLQQELLSPTGRAVDLNDLLETDFGRGTLAIIYDALSTRRINANNLMLAVLSSSNGRYYGQVLGMSLRFGADPNLYVRSGETQYAAFLYAIQNVKNPVYLKDYYLIMLARRFNPNNPIILTNQPVLNVGGRNISPRTTIAQYITTVSPQGFGNLNNLDPVTSSRIGIFTGRKDMLRRGSYTINDVVANHAPLDMIPKPDVMKAWVNMTLYAAIAYINYEVFSDTLRRMNEIPYPTANDIILTMYKIQLENRYLINKYYRMLADLDSKGYRMDVWQRRMLMRVSERSTPACANIAQQFPVDYSFMTSKMGEAELRTLNNICDYTNESQLEEGICADGESIPYTHNGRRYCFKPSQFSELLRTGVNPEDGTPLRPSFLNRIRNQYGAAMPTQDANVGQFIYKTGVTLEDKSPAQLEVIVREVFDTGNLRELEPEHARITAAWIGNWAYSKDPKRYDLYISRLGARSNNTPLGSVQSSQSTTNVTRPPKKVSIADDMTQTVRKTRKYPPEEYF